MHRGEAAACPARVDARLQLYRVLGAVDRARVLGRRGPGTLTRTRTPAHADSRSPRAHTRTQADTTSTSLQGGPLAAYIVCAALVAAGWTMHAAGGLAPWRRRFPAAAPLLALALFSGTHVGLALLATAAYSFAGSAPEYAPRRARALDRQLTRRQR
jgi:hypothetical protein